MLRQGSIVGNTYTASSPVAAGSVENSRIDLSSSERAALPAATGLTGATVVVTDGPGHKPTLAVSDGTDWLISPPGHPL